MKLFTFRISDRNFCWWSIWFQYHNRVEENENKENPYLLPLSSLIVHVSMSYLKLWTPKWYTVVENGSVSHGDVPPRSPFREVLAAHLWGEGLADSFHYSAFSESVSAASHLAWGHTLPWAAYIQWQELWSPSQKQNSCWKTGMSCLYYAVVWFEFNCEYVAESKRWINDIMFWNLSLWYVLWSECSCTPQIHILKS